MKKTVILLTLNLLTIMLVAQSNTRFNNDWDKTYIINPASINDQFLSEINIGARQQWVGLDGAPKTGFVSGTLFLDGLYHTQLGFRVTVDKIGFTNTTDADLTYAYSIMAESNWRWNMGLGLNFQSLNYDVSEIHSPTPSDPTVLSRLLKENDINSELGMELTNKIWRFGFASHNIFSLFGKINKLFINTNYVYAMHRDINHDFFNLGYGVRATEYSNLYQMEFNLTGFFKPTAENKQFQLSLLYRTWSELGILVSCDISRNFQVSYSFDYDINGISNNTFGTHEIMLTLRLDKAYKCRNCWPEYIH
jgi:type IX secretion system PorP/SprF family membrane protein